jgi:GNAT superfamily N-acetyltransferase
MDTLGHETRRLFQFLRRRWLPEPNFDEGFLKSLEGFSSIQDQMRSDRTLDGLSMQMYPDLQQLMLKPPTGSRSTASQDQSVDGKLSIEEVHQILQIIQTMEIAWMNSRMEDFDAHPLNRGWVAVFHRWAMMPAFRQAWPVLRADFSRSFIAYLQSRFSLAVEYSKIESLPGSRSGNKRVTEVLREEFQAEWPEIDAAFLKPANKLIWYVFPSVSKCSGAPTAKWELKDVPLGFVTLLPPSKGSPAAAESQGRFSCDEDAPELRFWVRPQYRFLGVGRHLLNQFALEALREKSPQKYAPKGSRLDDEYPAWNNQGDLVTRYFVRTGQEGGQNLRRRMQLGFLYEYSFCRQDDRPYDERPREEQFADRDHQQSHPSEAGVNRGMTINPQESVVPTILKTTWHQYFESARAMSGKPRQFKPFVPPAARY